MPWEETQVRQMRAKAARYAQPRGTSEPEPRPTEEPGHEVRRNALFSDITGYPPYGFRVTGTWSTGP